MADGDFTADARCALQLAVDEVFIDSPTQQAANRAAVTAQAVSREQTGRVPDQLINGSNCAGGNVIFLKTGDTIAYSGAISGDTLDCDLGPCVEGEAVALHVGPDDHIRACVTVNTDDCGSVTDRAVRRAHQLAMAIGQIRKAFSSKAALFLDANKQANTMAGIGGIDLGNGAWSLGAGSDVVGIPAADLSTSAGMASVARVVASNDIGDVFYIHSYPWWNDKYMSDFAGQNLGCCDYTTYQMYASGSHYWDLTVLDQIITPENGNTFAVNPSSYMFVPFRLSDSMQPVMLGDDTYKFYINDPNWVWSNGGRLQPVPYNVLMKRACTGRNAVGDMIFSETYEVRLTHALVAAPPDTDGNTGILHFAEQSTVA